MILLRVLPTSTRYSTIAVLLVSCLLVGTTIFTHGCVKFKRPEVRRNFTIAIRRHKIVPRIPSEITANMKPQASNISFNPSAGFQGRRFQGLAREHDQIQAGEFVVNPMYTDSHKPMIPIFPAMKVRPGLTDFLLPIRLPKPRGKQRARKCLWGWTDNMTDQNGAEKSWCDFNLYLGRPLNCTGLLEEFHYLAGNVGLTVILGIWRYNAEQRMYKVVKEYKLFVSFLGLNIYKVPKDGQVAVKIGDLLGERYDKNCVPWTGIIWHATKTSDLKNQHVKVDTCDLIKFDNKPVVPEECTVKRGTILQKALAAFAVVAVSPDNRAIGERRSFSLPVA